MVITHFIIGFITALAGILLFYTSSTAPQETVSALIILIGTVFLVGASIMGSINDAAKKLTQHSNKDNHQDQA